MHKKYVLVFVLSVTVSLMPAILRAETASDPLPGTNPLAPFARLIGGRWHLDGSYQEFEWGVGRRSVKARSYFVINDEPKLVSEGVWYWHPTEKVIKGLATAIDMPVEVFEYTTRFVGNSMLSDLSAVGSDGSRTEYVEDWEFRDDDHFVWTLFSKTNDSLNEEMQDTYTRKREASGPVEKGTE